MSTTIADIQHALSVIQEVKQKWYESPVKYYNCNSALKKVDFEYQSYKRSGINEIILYLLDHTDQKPIDAVEDFRYLMDKFACETKNGGANFMFSIYYDVATDILDVLLSMK